MYVTTLVFEMKTKCIWWCQVIHDKQDSFNYNDVKWCKGENATLKFDDDTNEFNFVEKVE